MTINNLILIEKYKGNNFAYDTDVTIDEKRFLLPIKVKHHKTLIQKVDIELKFADDMLFVEKNSSYNVDAYINTNLKKEYVHTVNKCKCQLLPIAKITGPEPVAHKIYEGLNKAISRLKDNSFFGSSSINKLNFNKTNKDFLKTIEKSKDLFGCYIDAPGAILVAPLNFTRYNPESDIKSAMFEYSLPLEIYKITAV